jgi:hypothetical protein
VKSCQPTRRTSSTRKRSAAGIPFRSTDGAAWGGGDQTRPARSAGPSVFLRGFENLGHERLEVFALPNRSRDEAFGERARHVDRESELHVTAERRKPRSAGDCELARLLRLDTGSPLGRQCERSWASP